MFEMKRTVTFHGTRLAAFLFTLLKQWPPMMSGNQQRNSPAQKIVFLCLMTVMFTREQRDVNHHRPSN
jgi:hypothetical protein